MKFLSCLFAGMSAMVLSSCDNPIYDDEGYCETHYLVRFKYDYNMKFADAFSREVDAVTLYLVDEKDHIVWRKTESGEQLKASDYAMEVDVAPGTYDLVAWCSSASPTTFRIGDGTLRHELTTDFEVAQSEDGTEYMDHPLDRLFHGYMSGVEFPAVEGATIVHTLPLTKDTNHFVVTLQQLAGEPIDEDLVEFEITDNNAHLGWDNTPQGEEAVTYRQWYKETVHADIGTETESTRVDNGTFAGVVAELTTSRLMYGNRDNARLRVYRTDTGATIASVRLIDALLLVMGQENSRLLTKQAYLDYKDEYNLTFFLDEDHRWLDGILQIESWRVVYREVTLD